MWRVSQSEGPGATRAQQPSATQKSPRDTPTVEMLFTQRHCSLHRPSLPLFEAQRMWGNG